MDECCECGEHAFTCTRCEGCLESVCDDCAVDHDCILAAREEGEPELGDDGEEVVWPIKNSTQ